MSDSLKRAAWAIAVVIALSNPAVAIANGASQCQGFELQTSACVTSGVDANGNPLVTGRQQVTRPGARAASTGRAPVSNPKRGVSRQVRQEASGTGVPVPRKVVVVVWTGVDGLHPVYSYRLVYDTQVPAPAATPRPTGAPAPVERVVDPQVIVQQAVARLTLPTVDPLVEPDPHNNKWGMLAVGLPVWLRIDQPETVSVDTTQDGIAISMTARRGRTIFVMGDGTTLTCHSGTPRPRQAPPQQRSPDCGHVYLKAGTYTITATTSWSVSWSTLGLTGVLDLRRSGSYALRVGELESVLIR